MYLSHEDRRRSLIFLIHISEVMKVQSVTKHCSFLFYEDRFLSFLGSVSELEAQLTLKRGHLNLYPMTLPNLQILALAALWIASKLHEANEKQPTTAEQLEKVASRYILKWDLKSKDIVEAEIVVLQAIKFNISCGPSIYSCLENLLLQFRQASTLGVFVRLEACEDLLDILYDLPEDYVDVLRLSKPLVASAILALGYVLCVTFKMAFYPLLTCDINLIQWLTAVAEVRGPQVELLIKLILSDVLNCPVEESDLFQLPDPEPADYGDDDHEQQDHEDVSSGLSVVADDTELDFWY